MATDTEVVKDLMAAEYASALGNADAKTEVAKVFRDTYTILKAAADTTNSTTTAAGALPPVSARFAGQVKVAYMNWNAAGTGTLDSTNNATLTLKAYPAAGVTGVTVATLALTAAITAFTRQSMTLATTASQLAVVDGAVFSLEIAKGGTGFTLPISSCEFEVERT
jgi:hypothetical protein